LWLPPLAFYDRSMAKVRGETVPKLDAFGGDVAVESWVLCEKVQTMKSDELHRTCEVR